MSRRNPTFGRAPLDGFGPRRTVGYVDLDDREVWFFRFSPREVREPYEQQSHRLLMGRIREKHGAGFGAGSWVKYAAEFGDFGNELYIDSDMARDPESVMELARDWFRHFDRVEVDGKEVSMKRRNPPKDIDSSFPQGAECTVWSIAAATGRSVPDARRAFMEAGVDLWTDGGYAPTGARIDQVRQVIKHLDYERRVVRMGMIGKGTELLRAIGSRRMTTFLSGSPPEPVKSESWDVRDVTVGSLVAQAKREGLAMIGVVQGSMKLVTKRGKLVQGPFGSYRQVTRSVKGSGHMVGYSPKMGFYDTSVARYRNEVISEETRQAVLADPVKFYAYGDDPPNPRRKVAFWVLFKGE